MSTSENNHGTPEHPYGPGSHSILANEREMPACYPIKGNIRDDGTRLYHRPDSRNYGATKPEIWFDSPTAAEAAGFRLAPTHPDGSTGASYEPGGSNHPCTIETIETNRMNARQAGASGSAAQTLFGSGAAAATGAGAGAPDAAAAGEAGLDIGPERVAFDTELHPYGVASRAPGADSKDAPMGYPIKGNVRRDGSLRYHRPDSTAYASTNAEVWFDSPTAAEAHSFELAASHPADADASYFEPGGGGHPSSRAEAGQARINALHGPQGAPVAGDQAAEGPAADSVVTSALGLGAVAAGIGAVGLLGRAGFDADLHPFGIGSHGLLAKALDVPDFHPIKGNIRNDGSRLYHRPDSRSYAVTKPEVWFDSPTAAEGAGFQLAPTHPAGSTGADFEPGGSGHPWSAADVEAARLRFHRGPDWSGDADATTGSVADVDTSSDDDGQGHGTGIAVAAGAAALAGGAALLSGRDDDAEHDATAGDSTEFDADLTAPVPAGAAAGAAAGGGLDADATVVADDVAGTGKSAIEELATSTLQLSGARAGTAEGDTAGEDESADSGSGLGAAAAAGAAGLGLAAAGAALAGKGDEIAEGAAATASKAADTAANVKDTASGAASKGKKGKAADTAAKGKATASGAAAAKGKATAGGAGAGKTAAGGAAAGTSDGERTLVGAGAGRGAVNASRAAGTVTGTRKFGPFAWLAAGAVGLLLLALIVSQCGGADTTDATGTTGAGSPTTVSAGAVSEPAGPEASAAATSAAPTTTEGPASSTAAVSSTATTTAAPTTTGDQSNDLQVRALAALKAAGFENVEVQVEANKLTLVGNVASAADAAAAESALATLDGMTSVDNALVVEEAPAANAVQGDPRYTG